MILINFIARTGRVNKFIAKIANLLNIKVILKGGKDATIQLYKKIYGRVKALKELASICASKIRGKEQKVYIAPDVVVWKCRNCGHIHVGKEAPKVCPACGHPQSYFELRVESY